MSGAREIKSRVNSIQSTRKVTKAMQMVSTAKMRRAVNEVTHIRPYAHGAWSILANLSRAVKASRNALLEKREVKKVLIILITSNRGLCGGFNTKISKMFSSYLKDVHSLKRVGKMKNEKEQTKEKIIVDVLSVGKKGEKMALSHGLDLIASFSDLMHTPSFEESRSVANMVIEGFEKKEYDKVCVMYTDYVSSLVQQTKVRQILPLDVEEFEKQLAEMDTLAKEYSMPEKPFEYTIEPSPEKVLEVLIPSLIRTMVYHMVLESNASKEASRMIAMKNATDAAGEIADELTLVYNRVRQSKITQEIAEISAGRAALEE